MQQDEPIKDLKTLPRFRDREIITIRGVEFFVFECHHFGLSLMVTNLPENLRNELIGIGAEATDALKQQAEESE